MRTNSFTRTATLLCSEFPAYEKNTKSYGESLADLYILSKHARIQSKMRHYVHLYLQDIIFAVNPPDKTLLITLCYGLWECGESLLVLYFWFYCR